MKELTAVNFDKTIREGRVTLVDFWATWCNPCQQLLKVLDQIGSDRVFKVDIEACPEIAEQFDIRSIPTIIVFKNGEPIDMLVGNQTKSKLLSILQKYDAL